MATVIGGKHTICTKEHGKHINNNGTKPEYGQTGSSWVKAEMTDEWTFVWMCSHHKIWVIEEQRSVE